MTTTRDLFTMRILPFVLAIAATGLLAACEPRGTHSPGDLTQSELNTGRGMVATDPARRQDLLNNCRARTQMKPERQRNNMAALMGVIIPMTMVKLGRDPAIGSSVMITAITDTGGFFIFLGLATLFLV